MQMTFNWTCDCVGPQENGKCPCENEKKKCECDDEIGRAHV